MATYQDEPNSSPTGRLIMFSIAGTIILAAIVALILFVAALTDDEPTQASDLEDTAEELLAIEQPTITPIPATITSPIPPNNVPAPANPTPVSSSCATPNNWMTYTVQNGDTFATIAAAVGLTVQELNAANCLPDPDNILVGQILYVPAGIVPLTGNGLLISPIVAFVNEVYTLTANQALTLNWNNPPAGAASIEFYYIPADTALPAVIANDLDMTDGAAAVWTVPEGTIGTLSATAFDLNGVEIATSAPLQVVAQ